MPQRPAHCAAFSVSAWVLVSQSSLESPFLAAQSSGSRGSSLHRPSQGVPAPAAGRGGPGVWCLGALPRLTSSLVPAVGGAHLLHPQLRALRGPPARQRSAVQRGGRHLRQHRAVGAGGRAAAGAGAVPHGEPRSWGAGPAQKTEGTRAQGCGAAGRAPPPPPVGLQTGGAQERSGTFRRNSLAPSRLPGLEARPCPLCLSSLLGSPTGPLAPGVLASPGCWDVRTSLHLGHVRAGAPGASSLGDEDWGWGEWPDPSL